MTVKSKDTPGGTDIGKCVPKEDFLHLEARGQETSRGLKQKEDLIQSCWPKDE